MGYLFTYRAGSYSAIERSYKQNQKMISAYRMRTERTQAKLSGYKRSNLETASKVNDAWDDLASIRQTNGRVNN